MSPIECLSICFRVRCISVSASLNGCLMCVILCFFFSSRRRHTRFDCDWSSDVCSSDLGASREDVVRAARDADAHEFVSEMPNAYDTLMAERGDDLSGGQRQRINIARA